MTTMMNPMAVDFPRGARIDSDIGVGAAEEMTPIAVQVAASRHSPVRPFPSDAGSSDSVDDGGPMQDGLAEEAEVPSYPRAMKKILQQAVPSMVTVAMVMLLSAITFAYVGQLIGTEAMGAASLAFFFTCIVALYPLTGVAFAVDTLCTQAYGRDKNSTALGAVAQRALVVSTILMIPATFFLHRTEALLVRWYPTEVARTAASWIAHTPMFVLPTLYCTVLTKFLCSQYLPKLPMIALIVAVITNTVVQRSLIPMYGFLGSIYGLQAAAWVQFLTIALLTWAHKDSRRRFGGWSVANLTDWKEYWVYLKLGLPSVAFIGAESGAFDVTALLAARLDPTASAAWAVMLSTLLVFDCVCNGLSIAVCACIGSALGAGRPRKAVRLAKAALLLAAVWSLVDGCLLFALHRFVFWIFTEDTKVLAALSEVAWVVIPFHFGDSIQFVFQGIFSGAGQNHLGAVGLVATLWALGIGSIVYFMERTTLGLLSVPLGLAIGLLSATPVLGFLCFYVFDWRAIAKLSRASQAEDDTAKLTVPENDLEKGRRAH